MDFCVWEVRIIVSGNTMVMICKTVHLEKLDSMNLREVKLNSGINYLGDGEILDVKKTPKQGKINL